MKLNEFIKLLTEALEIKDLAVLTPETPLADYWDSLGQINVLSMLDKHFQIVLKMDELINLKKVQDIVAILESRGVQLD